MPQFTYTAVDAKGTQTSGVVDASSQNEAASLIKGQGLFPMRIVAGVAQTDPKKAKARTKKAEVKAIPAKTLSVFTRQLATLIAAGLPLLRGLVTLVKQERNPNLKLALNAMAESIEGGSTFSDALAIHPNLFNKLYINMVKAGETGGVLDVVLERLAEFQEKSEKIKGKVLSALVYPIVVLIIAFIIVGFLMVYIVPKFQMIFKDMLQGAKLPGLTQLVIDISNFAQHYILLILGAIFLAYLGFKAFAATPFGSRLIDVNLLKIPVLGDLLMKTAISRFSRTLGTLVSSGVPILQALDITKETSENHVLSEAITKVHDSVQEGETIVTPLEACGIFPPLVISMIQVGEEVGKLPDMLVKVANVYDEEVDNAVVGLTSLLEPLMIVFLALVVGTIVVALFLPLISIIQNLGQNSG